MGAAFLERDALVSAGDSLRAIFLGIDLLLVCRLVGGSLFLAVLKFSTGFVFGIANKIVLS